MNRRTFIRAGAGAIGITVIGGYASSLALAAKETASQPKDLNAAEFRHMRRFAATSYGRIAYVEQGKGPAALFLHGFPLNSFQWRGTLVRLAPHRRCVAPDLMALGYTEIADGQSVSAGTQAAMLIALLDTLSISSVDIVANDSGGAVAQLFMTRYPERVRTVLLTNCDTEPDSPPAAVLPVIEMARSGTYPDKWLAPWLADKTLARSASGLGGMTFTNPMHLTDEAIEYYLAPLVSSPRRKAQTNAYAIALSPNPLAGIEPALRRSSVPTRILWGTGDNIFSQSSPEYLDRTLGNSRGVRRIDGAKLFFPEEMPELTVEEAKALWNVRK